MAVGGSWIKLTPEVLQTIEECFNKMAILNKRGTK